MLRFAGIMHLSCFAAAWISSFHQEGKCRLSESIPVHDYDLKVVEGASSTWEDLINLTEKAQHTLDITVMYWKLLSENQWAEKFESIRGRKLWEALNKAATRGVRIRVVNSAKDDDQNAEASMLVANHGADRVQLRYWDAASWYGQGIMHQKIWVADGRFSYLGSANQDWKSLSLVQELGVVCEGSVATDLQNYFNMWWRFAGINNPKPYLKTYFSDEAGTEITTPCWEKSVPGRCWNPLWKSSWSFLGYRHTSKSNPWKVNTGSFYVSASPGAVSTDRTADLDAVLDTIRTAKKTVKLSVMDVRPYAPYSRGIWFPDIMDAIVGSVFRGVVVQFLASHWLHTDPTQEKYLKVLEEMANVCTTNERQPCNGSLEVKIFKVPGWSDNKTYPPYTRVNHAKFVVSDVAVNVGTSNWDWQYFYNTAGASFHSDALDLVQGGNAIFDRNWNSAHAELLNTTTSKAWSSVPGGETEESEVQSIGSDLEVWTSFINSSKGQMV